MYLSTHGSESAGRALGEWHRTLGEWHRALCLCPRALSLCDRARSNALVRAVTDALSTLERHACVEQEWSTGKIWKEGGIHVGPWNCESTWRLTPRPGVSQVRGCMLVEGGKRERETVQTCQRRLRLCQCPASLLHPAEGETTTMREARQRTPVPRRPLPSIFVASSGCPLAEIHVSADQMVTAQTCRGNAFAESTAVVCSCPHSDMHGTCRECVGGLARVRALGAVSRALSRRPGQVPWLCVYCVCSVFACAYCLVNSALALCGGERLLLFPSGVLSVGPSVGLRHKRQRCTHAQALCDAEP